MIGIKNQNFGMELEFTGITRKAAAQIVAKTLNENTITDYIGGTYYTERVYDNQGRAWNIQRDASVETRNGDSCELVTPKCTYEDIETIQEIIRNLRKGGAKVNKSCGLHIHIDGANHDARSLRNLVYTFKAKENLIFKAVGTQEARLERWCKPIDDRLVDRMKKIRKVTDEAIRKTWYSTYGGYEGTTMHYHESRYHALNLHSMWYRGTVEFRCFEATLHAGEVRAYINLCLAMSAQAINQKRASADELNNGNEKYAMRCYLLRLGFIGDEWKNVRQHLLKRLEGNSAWRNAPSTYESYNRRQQAA